MNNPFEPINNRLTNLEGLTLEMIQMLRNNRPQVDAPADELLTPKETAQLLKVSTVTVWDWCKRGILKKHSIGNQVRYLRSEVLSAVLKKGAEA